jgi:type I restriction enzyme R subunit
MGPMQAIKQVLQLIQVKRLASNSKQQVFLDFVLSQYVQVGVQELEIKKLGDLLKLKYGEIGDAVAKLGEAKEIRKMFGGFQRYLY